MSFTFFLPYIFRFYSKPYAFLSLSRSHTKTWELSRSVSPFTQTKTLKLTLTNFPQNHPPSIPSLASHQSHLSPQKPIPAPTTTSSPPSKATQPMSLPSSSTENFSILALLTTKSDRGIETLSTVSIILNLITS